MDAVVFNQVRHRAVVGDVIDGNDFYLWMVDEQSKKVSSDASESVDGDFDWSHKVEVEGQKFW